MSRFKRPRVGASPERGVGTPSMPTFALQNLGDGVYRVGTSDGGKLTVACADYYEAFTTDGGAVIIDNSADLGLFEGGLLLQDNSKLYLGFASPSSYSVIQVASSLEMFHDIFARRALPSLQMLSMTKLASNARPATHKCLRFNFPIPKNSVWPGAIETLDAVENYIDEVVREAIATFITRYRGTSTFAMPSERSPDLLSIFLAWVVRTGPQTKLFISVHQLHRVLQRPIDAAVSNGLVPSKPLSDRLDLVRRLLLTPIWKQLASNTGVVRKFLIVGPHHVDSLIYPPSHADYPGLPPFTDLSSHETLHGFSSSQIRVLYRLPKETVPFKNLKGILRYCNIAGRMDSAACGNNELREVYTKESLQSVFALATLESIISNVPPPNFGEEYAASYLEETLEPARRALFPLFIRNPVFRSKVLRMLDADRYRPGCAYDSMGPTFSITDIANNDPPEGKMHTRLFMLGLMSKYERLEKKPIYAIAGGCAHKLLRTIANETTDEKYTEPYQRRKRTPGDGKKPEKAIDTAQQANVPAASVPPPVADEDLPALNLNSIDNLFFTETSIANLILDHYRPMTNSQQLPANEAEFQETFVQLLRAALWKEGLFDSFFHHVQVEVWLRRREAPPGKSHNIRCDVVVRIRFGTTDYVYIFELKYFNLRKTMEATHAILPEGFLESQTLAKSKPKYENRQSLMPWELAKRRFLLEIASIPNLPLHWYADELRRLKDLPLSGSLSIDHIRANYEETPDGMEGSSHTTTELKQAVVVASDAVRQVEEYRDVAVLGVADELVRANQLLPDRIATQLGWADKRITDMGPGKTRIVPFAIVNVAGALVYVHKVNDVVIQRRIGIVDAYPWMADPSKAVATDLMKRKQAVGRIKV